MSVCNRTRAYLEELAGVRAIHAYMGADGDALFPCYTCSLPYSRHRETRSTAPTSAPPVTAPAQPVQHLQRSCPPALSTQQPARAAGLPTTAAISRRLDSEFDGVVVTGQTGSTPFPYTAPQRVRDGYVDTRVSTSSAALTSATTDTATPSVTSSLRPVDRAHDRAHYALSRSSAAAHPLHPPDEDYAHPYEHPHHNIHIPVACTHHRPVKRRKAPASRAGAPSSSRSPAQQQDDDEIVVDNDIDDCDDDDDLDEEYDDYDDDDVDDDVQYEHKYDDEDDGSEPGDDTTRTTGASSSSVARDDVDEYGDPPPVSSVVQSTSRDGQASVAARTAPPDARRPRAPVSGRQTQLTFAPVPRTTTSSSPTVISTTTAAAQQQTPPLAQPSPQPQAPALNNGEPSPPRTATRARALHTQTALIMHDHERRMREALIYPLTTSMLLSFCTHACNSPYCHHVHWPNKRQSQGTWRVIGIIGHIDDDVRPTRYAVQWCDNRRDGIAYMLAEDFQQPCLIDAYNRFLPPHLRRSEYLAVRVSDLGDTLLEPHDIKEQRRRLMERSTDGSTTTTTPLPQRAADRPTATLPSSSSSSSSSGTRAQSGTVDTSDSEATAADLGIPIPDNDAWCRHEVSRLSTIHQRLWQRLHYLRSQRTFVGNSVELIVDTARINSAIGITLDNMSIIKRRLGWINHYPRFGTPDDDARVLTAQLLGLSFQTPDDLAYTASDLHIPFAQVSLSDRAPTGRATFQPRIQYVYYNNPSMLAAAHISARGAIPPADAHYHRCLIDPVRILDTAPPTGFEWRIHRSIGVNDQTFLYLMPLYDTSSPASSAATSPNVPSPLGITATVTATTTVATATTTTSGSPIPAPQVTITITTTSSVPTSVPALQQPLQPQARRRRADAPQRAPASPNARARTRSARANQPTMLEAFSSAPLGAPVAPPTSPTDTTTAPQATPTLRMLSVSGTIYTPRPTSAGARFTPSTSTTPAVTTTAPPSAVRCPVTLELAATSIANGHATLNDRCSCGVLYAEHLPQSRHPSYYTPSTSTSRAPTATGTLDIASLPRFSSQPMPYFRRSYDNRKVSTDPDLYLRAVQEHIVAKNYHRSLHEHVIFHGCVNNHDQEWVRSNILNAGISWTDVQNMFLAKFRTPTITGKYYTEYENIHASRYPTPFAFMHRVDELIQLIQANPNEYTVIRHVEQALPPTFREKLQRLKTKLHIAMLSSTQTTSTQPTSPTSVSSMPLSSSTASSSSSLLGVDILPLESTQGSEFRFASMADLFKAISNINQRNPNLWNNAHETAQRRRRTSFAPYKQQQRDISPPRAAKLEPSSSGQPTRVGGRYKPKQKGQQPRQHKHGVPPQPTVAALPDPLTAPTQTHSSVPAPVIMAIPSHAPPSQRPPPTTTTMPSSSSSIPVCGKCNKRGHTSEQHIDNFVPKCDTCGGRHTTHAHAHLRPRPPQRSTGYNSTAPTAALRVLSTASVDHLSSHTSTNHLAAYAPALDTPTLRALLSSPTQRDAFMTVKEIDNHNVRFTEVMFDTGADLSCISRKAVEQFHLPVARPNGVQVMAGFSADMRTLRIGTINLHVCMHVPVERRPVVSFTKTFEVVDMKDDFLIGRDILPLLFPNDSLLRYTAPHSSITDTPTQVSYGHASAIDEVHSSDEEDDRQDPYIRSVGASTHAPAASSSHTSPASSPTSSA